MNSEIARLEIERVNPYNCETGRVDIPFPADSIELLSTKLRLLESGVAGRVRPRPAGAPSKAIQPQ